MPIGVPRIIYCWGEELPAQWTDIYNFIFRRRMVFLMQYLDDELCNQICGLLINIHMEDRSKDLERKEMERSGVFKSGTARNPKTTPQKSGLEQNKGGATPKGADSLSREGALFPGVDTTNITSKETTGDASTRTFYNKKSRSMEDLLNADEDLGIDEIDTLEQHTLQKITTEWLNWNAQFFDYSDEPYLFYLAELLSKDFNQSGALSARSKAISGSTREAAQEESFLGRTPRTRSFIDNLSSSSPASLQGQNKNEIAQLLTMLLQRVSAPFSLLPLSEGNRDGKNSESTVFHNLKVNNLQTSQQSPSDIYAPFRTYANFSSGNFALKDINSLAGKEKLLKLFQDYKKAPLFFKSQKSNSSVAEASLETSGSGKGQSSLKVNKQVTRKQTSKVERKGNALSSLSKTSVDTVPNLKPRPLNSGISNSSTKKKHIWKLLLENLADLSQKDLFKTVGAQSESLKQNMVGAGNGSVAFAKAKGSLQSKKILLPSLRDENKQETASFLAYGKQFNKEEAFGNFSRSTKKVLSQRNLRQEYSLDAYHSSENSLIDPNHLWHLSSRSQRSTRKSEPLTSLNYADSTSSNISPEGQASSAYPQKGKSPEFRDYYRKQTERALIEEESKKVFVIINSFGGSVGNGVTVHDALQFIKAGSLTLALGVAASAASLALAGGTIGERYVTEGCHVMIHQPESSLQGQASDIWIDSQEIMKIRLDVAEIYSLSTYRPRHKILRDLDRDFYLTATETIQYGLADEIATNEVMHSIIEMTSQVWDYHDSKQQSLLESRGRQQDSSQTQTDSGS